MLLLKLPGLEPEQLELSIAPDGRSQTIFRQMPLMNLIPDEAEEYEEVDRPRPGPGQLVLGSNQPELAPVPPAPKQLALLPDPPPWEVEDPPRRERPQGRLARKRSREGVSPGQMTLFGGR